MLDTIIRGDIIINDTGSSDVNGDIATANGRIVSVGGRITDSAHEEIDADGAF
jgi:dihydroorotase-like cyclic amidohydrolase